MDVRIEKKIHSCNSISNAFKLRYRKFKDRYCLYADIQKDGIRKKMSLKLFISGNPYDYDADKLIIQRAKLIISEYNQKYEIRKNIDFINEIDESVNFKKLNFITLFKKYYEDKYIKKTTKKPFQNTVKHLRDFAGSNIKIAQINKSFCFRFKNYLDKTNLKNSSKNSYLQKFKEVIAFLLENKIIKENPIPKKYSFKVNTPDREYLTEAELKKLISTPYPEYSFVVCNAFIFSCLTGLRWNDLFELKFSDIRAGILKIKQGKTNEFVEFELPERAKKIVNEMKQFQNDKIFQGIGSDYRGNKKIKIWVEKAKIAKNITWHIARHTFACLLILKKVDLYHISRLLGHTDIKHTTKYLHMLKEHKTKATEVLSTI
ncbi:MAG: site-specific integrase [Candidatus Cloacimonetes bacterium]|nr:site-specific integrase [Candidatus Cloacimonadota bacterium]